MSSLRTALAPLALACSLWACSDADGDTPPSTEPTPDVGDSTDTAPGDDVTAPDTAVPDVDQPPLDECSPDWPSQVWILSEVTVGRIVDGVSQGFDLNVRAAEGGEVRNCGKRTFRRPDGTTGINNQFGTLMPAIELTELGALETLIQTAINDGFLLLMAELNRLSNPENDACVDFRILRGDGVPMVGNDNRVLSGQTYDRFDEPPLGEATNITLENGAIEAGPFDLDIQFVFFGNDIFLTAYRSYIHFELRADGTAHGFIGGALSVPELNEFASGLNDGGDIGAQLARFLSGAADLFPDENGVCDFLSIVLEFEARPAYFFAE